MNGIAPQTSPHALFDFLKLQVIYKNDPPGIELIQSMGTMFENNYHNIKGAGDCDCFTVTAMSCLYVLGYKTGFILYYNGMQPSHIGALYIDSIGEIIPFDLTASYSGELRNYKRIVPYIVTL